MKFTHLCFKVLLIPWVERQTFAFAAMNADILDQTTSELSRECFPGEEAKRATLRHEDLKILQSTEALV